MTPPVTSLELSKRLKALGVPQKSLIYWNVDGGYVYDPLIPNHHVECSAYLTDEIMRWLPDKTVLKKLEDSQYLCDQYGRLFNFIENSPAESCGGMLKELIKRGIVKVEDMKV